jgi:hypothetical protein
MFHRSGADLSANAIFSVTTVNKSRILYVRDERKCAGIQVIKFMIASIIDGGSQRNIK